LNFFARQGEDQLTEKYTNNKGNSLVELIMVMMLLILFCMTMYTIIYAGSTAQTKITDRKDIQIDARVALAYVNTKLRQNDETGKISVEKNPLNGENAIVFRHRAGEESFDTWIYYAYNAIYEFIGLVDEPPDIDLSIAIIEFDQLVYKIDYDENTNTIHNRIIYQYGETKKELSSLVHLRAE
jgi:hypothetical protein